MIHRADVEKCPVPMPENFSLEQLLPDKGENNHFITTMNNGSFNNKDFRTPRFCDLLGLIDNASVFGKCHMDCSFETS